MEKVIRGGASQFLFLTEYYFRHQMQYDEMGKISGTYEEERNVFSILMGQHERRRYLGRPRCRWEDSVKIYLKKYDVMTWIVLIGLRIWTRGGLVCVY